MFKKKRTVLFLLLVPALILLLFYLEERRPYEVIHSTVMTSSNLTEYKMTLVLHSLLPIDEDKLAREVVEKRAKLNRGQPNPYYELELYRTMFHYNSYKIYDRLLVNEKGEIVTEIDESVFK